VLSASGLVNCIAVCEVNFGLVLHVFFFFLVFFLVTTAYLDYIIQHYMSLVNDSGANSCSGTCTWHYPFFFTEQAA